MADLADDMCYNDTCEVLTPNGYPIIVDRNHLVNQYARNWAGSVDFITKFWSKKIDFKPINKIDLISFFDNIYRIHFLFLIINSESVVSVNLNFIKF